MSDNVSCGAYSNALYNWKNEIMTDSQVNKSCRLEVSDQDLCEMHITYAAESLALAVKHLDCAVDISKRYDKKLSGSLAYLSGLVLANESTLERIKSDRYKKEM